MSFYRFIAFGVLPLLSFDVLAVPNDIVELDRIFVTADESPEAMLDEAPGTTRFDWKSIEERQFRSVQDIAGAVPNLNVMSTGTRSYADVISLRGLSHIPFDANPSVLFYIDDVPYAGPFNYANQLYGVESIQVLRGPQNADFGANAYGGVINVKSRRPQDEWHTAVSVSGGNFDHWHGTGYTGGALIPGRLYFTLAGTHAQRDGYLKNTFLGNRPDSQEQSGGRASLQWTPSANWDVRLSATLDKFRDGAPRIVPLTDAAFNPLEAVSFETRSNLNGRMEQSINSQSLRLGYRGEGYEVVSVTARRHWKIDPFLADTDLTPLPLAVLEFRENQEQWLEEFRIRSTADDSAWNWSAGFYFSNSQRDGKRRFTFFGIDDAQQWLLEENRYAVFGKLGFKPIEPLRLQAGLRFDYVDNVFDWLDKAPGLQTIPSSARNESLFVSPKLEADYRLLDRLSAHASTALAYKPGGFRPFIEAGATNEFDSERSWANELGLKWADAWTRANLTLFYYRIRDYQVERFLSPFDLVIVNADRADSYGVEFEFNTMPWQGLTFESAFGYNLIEFKKHRDPATGTDLSGNKAPFAPEFNLMLAAEYRHAHGYFARTEGVWTGRTYFDQYNSGLFREDRYTVFNARIGFERKHFALYAYGNNLTDTRYFTFKLPSAFSGTPGEPRTFGVQLSLNY